MKSLVNKLLKNLQKNILILVYQKKEQCEKLSILFAGLYQKAKYQFRKDNTKELIKFVERQEDLRKAIGDHASKLIRKYRKEKLDQKSKKYQDANSQLNGTLGYLISEQD